MVISVDLVAGEQLTASRLVDAESSTPCRPGWAVAAAP